MAFSFLQGLIPGTSNSSLNGENTDFYRGAEGSDDESDLEEDILVEMNKNDESVNVMILRRADITFFSNF